MSWNTYLTTDTEELPVSQTHDLVSPGFCVYPPHPRQTPSIGLLSEELGMPVESVGLEVEQFESSLSVDDRLPVQTIPPLIQPPVNANIETQSWDMYAPGSIEKGANRSSQVTLPSELSPTLIWDTVWSNRFLGDEIPQRRYTHRGSKCSDLRPVEFFTVNGRGFSIRDALDQRYEGLVGRDDRSMFDRCGNSIILRIEWPGYKPWNCQIRTIDWRKAHKPVTLANITSKIAKSLVKFIQEMEDVKIDDKHARWRVGTGHIDIDDVVLVALDPVTNASWQPQFFLKKLLKGAE